MDGLRDMDEASYTGSDDLLEYTTEEVEDEHEELDHASMEIEFEDMVDDCNQPGETTEEEYYEEDDTGTSDILQNNSKPTHSMTTSGTISAVPKIQKISDFARNANRVIMVPQNSTTAGTAMKLLNSSQASVASTMATTSYRLVNSDGTMIMNVTSKPSTVKKVISVAGSNSSVQSPAKVVLNTNTRVMQIKPQNVSTTSSTQALKTMTVGKTITMKTIPPGCIKMVSQAAPISSGVQGTVLRMTKPNTLVQGVPLATSAKIAHDNATGSSTGMSKVIIKPGNAHTTSVKKIISPSSTALHAVTLPGGKGVKYVRLLNQAPTAGSTVQKIVMQPANKPLNSTVVATTSGTSAVANVAPGGTVQASSSKIFVQNNKTYVVRNGPANVASTIATTNSVGKSSILSGHRKIVISANSIHTQEVQNSGVTRVIIKKDDNKPLDSKVIRTIVQKAQVISNRTESETNVTPRKQDQDSSETEKKKNNSVQQSGGGGKTNDTSLDASRSSTSMGYGFPEEAYKKRPCNCTKSQCLKLYCDCFANGEFCYNCNCKDCYNTFEHSTERQKAIRSTLERNPNAFKPKIGSIGTTDDGTRLHTKGCNCKRSGCLKNYCECYEGKIACSSNCKCVGCRNTDKFGMEYDYYSPHDASSKSFDDGRSSVANTGTKLASLSDAKLSSSELGGLKRSGPFLDAEHSELPPTKQPHHFMTLDVIEATVQCMVAQADECSKRGCSMRTSERMILEEYGRCLLEIKEFAFHSEN